MQAAVGQQQRILEAPGEEGKGASQIVAHGILRYFFVEVKATVS